MTEQASIKTTERRGRTAVAAIAAVWLLALSFWPGTVFVSFWTGWGTVRPGFFEIHESNSVGFIGFTVLAPMATAVTAAVLAYAHIISRVDASSADKFVRAGIAFIVTAIASIATYLVAQMFGFFFIVFAFEGLF